jgi:excisionase family DNA binding protein
MEKPRTYTIQELAEILQLSVMTIRRYIAQGLIKPIILGGATRFSQAEVDRLLGVSSEE